MRNRILFMLCFLFVGFSAFAQVSISGKVVDNTGFELPGVNVVVKGTTVGTMTLGDGTYSLPDVPGGSKAVLEFSYIGFKPIEVVVGNQKVINVTMVEDSEQLEEVVVVAYGTQKKKDLTGSISSIDSKILTTQSTSSATKALEGAIPGLQVSAVDGQPGFDGGIRVRGIGSTNADAANALIVIDGVPVTYADGADPLSTLNSSDIENITVLKDAASTALYGSRGANGVVLVTTKKGKSGTAQVQFSGRWGWNSIGNFNFGGIDNAADYYEYAWKSVYNSYRYGVNGTGNPGVSADGSLYTNVKNPNYSHEQAAEFASQHLFDYIGSETSFGRNNLGNYMAYNVPGAIYTPTGSGSKASSTMTGAYLVGTDGKINPNAVLLYEDSYADELLKTGFRQQYDVSINGGSEKVKYFASLGYLSDPSFIENSKFSRYSGRASVDADVFSWFKMGAQMSYAKTNTQSMALTYGRSDAGSNQGNVMRFINGHNANVPVYAYDANGNYIYNSVTGTNHHFLAGGTYSPLGPVDQNYGATDIIYSQANDKRMDSKDAWTSRVYGEISFLKDFKLRGTLGFDQNILDRTRYTQSLVGRDKNKGGYSKYSFNYQNLNSQVMLSYNKSIKDHNIDAMALHEFNKFTVKTVQYGTAYEFMPGFVSPYNFVGKYTGAYGMTTPSASEQAEVMESYLGRVNYDYKSKYYASASVRADGSSKFKVDKWGVFWSVGGGWRFTAEEFMKDTESWLDNGKLRASYGVIGNASGVGRYSGFRTWSVGSQYTQTSGGTGTPNGVWTVSMGGMVNDKLTWEETQTWDVGLDLSFLNSRLTATLDFYNRLTTNSFYNKPVSLMATGQASLQANEAGIRNRGIEFEIGADIIRTKDWTWNVSLNGTHYKTVLASVPEGSIPDNNMLPAGTYEANSEGWSAQGASAAQGGGFYLRGVGRDWYNLYIRKYAGVDQNSGTPLYYHRVDADDHAAGRFTDKAIGEDVTTTNTNLASKYEVGSAIPKLIGGLNTTLKYKDFDFTAVLAFQLGGYFFSRDYAENLYKGSSIYSRTYVQSQSLIGNTWTPENTSAQFPMQWYYTGSGYVEGTMVGSWMYTDMSLFNASYLRVKNLTLGYTLPKSITQKALISNARVYVSGDNLFMVSAAKGIDPSMSLIGGMEVDAYAYPTMRTISVGVNVTF
ncbi:MAG: TonB-dependent receptor [Parabacteroides sp.]|nr:TonB-dependent receptor [Parabacteroides sp.]